MDLSNSGHCLHGQTPHSSCFACGPRSEKGLGLVFRMQPGGSVGCCCSIGDDFVSYDGIVHGGILSTLLDSGMYNLFALKYRLNLKTAKLSVTFRKPVPVNSEITVTAYEDKPRRHFYSARARLMIGKVLYAEASGLFR